MLKKDTLGAASPKSLSDVFKPEKWKNVVVPSHPALSALYAVSSWGRVQALPRVAFRFYHNQWVEQPRKARILKPRCARPEVILNYPSSTDGKGGHVRVTVSRLVAFAFLPKVKNQDELEVRHRDDDTTNNHATNLEWGTHLDNMQDRQDRNRTARGEALSTVLREKDVRRIKNRIAKGCDNVVLAEEFNCHPSTINCIRTGRTWTHV